MSLRDVVTRLEGFDGQGRMDIEITLGEIVDQLTPWERRRLRRLLSAALDTEAYS